MLGDRRLSFAVEFDQPCIKPQLRSAEANQFLTTAAIRFLELQSDPDCYKEFLIGKSKFEALCSRSSREARQLEDSVFPYFELPLAKRSGKTDAQEISASFP
jgi:hypothetical protein